MHLWSVASLPPSAPHQSLSSSAWARLHPLVVRHVCLFKPNCLSRGSCSDRLPHMATVAPSFSPQKSKSFRPADCENGGADIAASPSILVALLICCSAHSTAHVGDLYPASSNSSVRFVSFRIVVISACSWPSQHSCFFRKFHLPLLILHPRPGSRHVVRPSVVMILVSSTRSSHTCDAS